MMSNDGDFLQACLRTLPLHRAMVRAVEAALFAKHVPDMREPILDIGSGDGSFVEMVVHGKRIIGIDPKRRDTHEAAGREVYTGLSVANGESLPFGDACFASAMSNCVLEHVLLLDETLREVARVLVSGGLFVASVVGNRFAHDLLGTTVLNALGLNGQRYGQWFNRLSVHHHTLSANEWSQRFLAAGFEVVAYRPYFNATALKIFDFSHYYAAPALITRRLFGRWILCPQYTPNVLWEPILRSVYDTPPEDDGPYYFFMCRKRKLA
jgi:ubiquinone/menaquinone biosynthesis C-methylase UbiE